MDYKGTILISCLKNNSSSNIFSNQKNIMLIKNIRSGYNKLRFLDIKIGAWTAVSGWQGKNALASALQQIFIDRKTNT